MLARVLGRQLFDPVEWVDWVESALTGDRAQRVVGPALRQRRIDVARVRAWMRMRGSCKPRKARKRTAFTVRRTSHLYGGGRNLHSRVAE